MLFFQTDLILVLNSANGPFGILTKFFRKKHVLMLMDWSGLGLSGKVLDLIIMNLHLKIIYSFFEKIITDSEEMNNVYIQKYNTSSTVIAYGSTMINTNSLRNFKKI